MKQATSVVSKIIYAYHLVPSFQAERLTEVGAAIKLNITVTS